MYIIVPQCKPDSAYLYGGDPVIYFRCLCCRKTGSEHIITKHKVPTNIRTDKGWATYLARYSTENNLIPVNT